MHARHLIKRLGVAMILGVIATIGLSWISAIAVVDSVSNRYGSQLLFLESSSGDLVRTEWHFSLNRTPCGTRAISTIQCPGDLYDEFTNLSISDFPSWSSIPSHASNIAAGDGLFLSRVEEAHGWPFLALRGMVDITTEGNGEPFYQTHGAILLGTQSNLSAHGFRFLSVIPIWAGMVVDSLIFGLLFWCATLAIAVLQARIRRKRDQCCVCGYVVKGVPRSPECGSEAAT